MIPQGTHASAAANEPAEAGLRTDVLSYLTVPGGAASDVSFRNAMADVALQKNVYLHGEYAFGVDTEGGKSNDKDAWTVSLNYVF